MKKPWYLSWPHPPNRPGSPDISRILQFLILRTPVVEVNVTNRSQLATNAIAVYIRISLARSIQNSEISNHPWNITCEINLEATTFPKTRHVCIYIYTHAIITAIGNTIPEKPKKHGVLVPSKKTQPKRRGVLAHKWRRERAQCNAWSRGIVYPTWSHPFIMVVDGGSYPYTCWQRSYVTLLYYWQRTSWGKKKASIIVSTLYRRLSESFHSKYGFPNYSLIFEVNN